MTRNTVCLRFSVALLTFTTFLISSFIAGGIYWWQNRLNNPSLVRHSVLIWTISFALFAFASLIGFVGVLTRHRSFVALYEYFYLIVWLVKLGMAIYVIVKLYILRLFIIGQCFIADLISDAHGLFKKKLCTKYYDEGLHGLMAAFILLQVISLLLFFMVRAYVRELKQVQARAEVIGIVERDEGIVDQEEEKKDEQKEESKTV